MLRLTVENYVKRKDPAGFKPNYVVVQKPDRVDYEAGMRRSVQREAGLAEFE